MTAITLACVKSVEVDIEQDPAFAPWQQFLALSGIPTQCQPRVMPCLFGQLPRPMRFLLSQPLMTQGIQQFYGRTPKIRPPIQTYYPVDENTYFRAITMIVDQDPIRDHALIADGCGESQTVALGLIHMHLAALPDDLILAVLKGQTPFGALLTQHSIPTQSHYVYYQVLDRYGFLRTYLPQVVDSQVPFYYARTNTLRDSRTGVWLARTFEILPTMTEEKP